MRLKQAGRGQLTHNSTGAQSFINKFSQSLNKKFGTFIKDGLN